MKSIKNKKVVAVGIAMFVQCSLLGSLTTTGQQQALKIIGPAIESKSLALANFLNIGTTATSTMPKISTVPMLPNASTAVMESLAPQNISNVSSYALPAAATATVVAAVLGSSTARSYAQNAWNSASGWLKATPTLRMSNRQMALEAFDFPKNANPSTEEIQARYLKLVQKHRGHWDLNNPKVAEINQAFKVFQLDPAQQNQEYVGYTKMSYEDACNVFGFQPNEILTKQMIMQRYVKLSQDFNPVVVGNSELLNKLNDAYAIFKGSAVFAQAKDSILPQMSYRQALQVFGFIDKNNLSTVDEQKLSKEFVDDEYKVLSKKFAKDKQRIILLNQAYDILRTSKKYEPKDQQLIKNPDKKSYDKALKVFGFTSGAKLLEEDITARYRSLVKQYHPDSYDHNKGIHEITDASNILKAKIAYDKQALKGEKKEIPSAQQSANSNNQNDIAKPKETKKSNNVVTSSKNNSKQSVQSQTNTTAKVAKTVSDQSKTSYDMALKEFGFKTKDKPSKKEIESRYAKLLKQHRSNKKTIKLLNDAYKILKK